jgi:polyphosphate kinase
VSAVQFGYPADGGDGKPATNGSSAALTPVAQAPRYLNRELSRLEFNARVLAQAQDQELPVLERVRFLAIFNENLDEFFQVQVASIKDKVIGGFGGAPTVDGLSPSEQFRAVREKVHELLAAQLATFTDVVVPALASAGISLTDWEDLNEADRAHLVEVFDKQIFRVLTPLSVDPAHPFPEISNLSLNLAVVVVNPGSGERRFARVKVPALLPRFVVTPDGHHFVPLEQVIAAQLPMLFRGMTIESHFPFRVTRNADLIFEEEGADDLLEAIELELRRRRFGRAVRLEVDAQMTDEVRDILLRELELEPDDLYSVDGFLDLGGLWEIYDLDRPELKNEVWAPMTQPALASAEGEPVDLFSVLRTRDVLVHHPYDSFTTSVEELIKQAAADPKVLAIKQTLYRTGGDSPIVEALIDAAEAGIQVVVLVELKARFDEEANIAWARRLEEAGAHVVYGIVGLKTHAKIVLIVRDEDGELRRYCHFGTGNYNARTARLYTDIGVLSSDEELTDDLTELFNYLTGYSRGVDYKRILVAPGPLRPAIIDLIHQEARVGSDGRIIIKVNHLVDPAVIDALYEASQAGVEIDLIIRSICCLRPGVPGLSETIRVRSIVGRYLEHSRIFLFGGRSGRPRHFYVGSADLWQRNLDRRVEVLAPVSDPALQDELDQVLETNLLDDTCAWDLRSDGTWSKVPTVRGVDTFLAMQDRAHERARRRRTAEAASSVTVG